MHCRRVVAFAVQIPNGTIKISEAEAKELTGGQDLFQQLTFWAMNTLQGQLNGLTASDL